MESADSSRPSREVTPEQDPTPETERNEDHTSERVTGSDLMEREVDYSGLHQLLDEIHGIASPILQFTLQWKDIDENFASLENLLKERSREVEVKERSVMERIVELEKKESEATKVLEERGKEVERLSKCNEDKSRELDKAVKDFDLKQKESLKQLEARERVLSEKVSELKKKQEIFVAQQMAKDEEMELKMAELEKKEMIFEVELKAKAEEMDVKEKKLDEREKELDLKQRQLEQVVDELKLKERELQERAETCKRPRKQLLTVNVSASPQEINNAHEEEPEEIKIVDSEFHDFKKTISSFVVDKIWALYDPRDDMPRCYAIIKRINKSRLSLDVLWLEPKDDESVPVACGRFTYGKRETVSHLTLSHELKPIRLGRSITVNPKEGEIWAVFRDWSESWENQHKPPYRYDLVEVVLLCEDDQGVGVTYLGKVEGFVSVFKQAVQHGVFQRLILPNEMRRFSHRVPSVRLSGEEKEGVPAGSFELDPAAVPSYILLGEKEPDVV